MAKLRGPLLSFQASQKLGGTLSYQHRPGLKRVTSIPIPSQPRTLPQVYHRQDYADYVLWWNLLSAADKAAYETLATGQNFTPYNAWMANRLINLPDLAARWHLDEPHAGVYQDSSRNTNHATIFGPAPVPGIWGQCLSFDGLDDYLDCGNDLTLRPSTAITLEAWVNPVDFAAPYMPIARNPNFNYEMQLMAGTESARFLLSTAGGLTNLRSPLNSLLAGVWQHIMLTYDGAVHTVYVNGIPQTPFYYTGPFLGAITDTSTKTYIGRRGGLYAKTLIEEPRIYHRALSAPEAYAHWLRGAQVLGVA